MKKLNVLRVVSVCTGCFFGALGLWGSDAAAAAPDDIVQMEEILREAVPGRGLSPTQKSASTTLLVNETLERVDAIARQRGYPSFFSSTNPVIQKRVKANVRALMERDARDAKGLFEVSASVFAGVVAETAMAEAAGHAPPKVLGGVSAAPLPTRGVSTPSGPLKLVAELSSVSGDRGMIGSGNGIIDAGELAAITLVFKNTSKKRLYSTSLYVQGGNECALVQDSLGDEKELPELEPGEVVSLRLPIYVSSECAGRTASVTIKGHDTHEFPGGVTYRVSFPLASLATSKLTSVRLDGDDYGHSEPTSTKLLVADDRVELSAGLSVATSGLFDVEQSFFVPVPLKSSHSAGLSRFRYANGKSIASPVDDVDITVPSKSVLAGGLRDWADRFDWRSPSDAYLFVAVDSRIRKQSGGGSSTAGSDGGGATSGTASSVVINKAKVESAIAKHVTITPVTRRGANDGSWIMVDGFDVSVGDTDALMEALSAAVTTKASSGGAGDAAAKRSAAAGGRPSYGVRHYIALPIEWVPPKAEVECALRVTSRVEQGGWVSVRGAATNVPAGAIVSLVTVSGRQEVVLNEDGAFTSRIRAERVGRNTVTMEVAEGSAQLCTARSSFTTEAPEVEAPKPAVKPQQEWPRTISLEPGAVGFASAAGAQVGFSAGSTLRFVSRLTVVDGSAGFGVGFRVTAPTRGDVVFEPSAQLLVGGDGYIGGFAEGAVTIAVHGGAGPFLTVGGGNSREGSYGLVAGGVGFYFPSRK